MQAILVAEVFLGFGEYPSRRTCLILVSVSPLPQHTVAIRFISIHVQGTVLGSSSELTTVNKKDPVFVLRVPTISFKSEADR